MLKLTTGLSFICLLFATHGGMAEPLQNSSVEVSFRNIHSVSTRVQSARCDGLFHTFVLAHKARLMLDEKHPITVSPLNSILSLYRPSSSMRESSKNDLIRHWLGHSKISVDDGKTFIEVPFEATVNRAEKTGKMLIPHYCQADFVFHKIS